MIYEWWNGSNGPNENLAFDNWVEYRAGLESYFREWGVNVEWKSVYNAFERTVMDRGRRLAEAQRWSPAVQLGHWASHLQHLFALSRSVK